MSESNTPLDGEIIPPTEDQDDFERQQKKVNAGFWRSVKKAIAHIPFMSEVVAAYFCTLDSATPFRVRAMLTGALFYFVLPLDAVPDFLAGVGFTDDAAVLLGTLNMLRVHIKPAHRNAAATALKKLRAE